MARTLVADQAGRATRERILRAALEAFAERGYAGTSLTAVAKRAGLSGPGLLHHFPDKCALLAAVLETHGQKDLETGERAVEFADLDLDAALELLIRITERNLAHRDVIRLAHLCALAADDGTEVAVDWARARLERLRADILAFVAQARARGEIPDGAETDAAASLITATFLGLEHQWLVDESFDMVGGMRAFTRLLAAQLRPVAS
ncbi:MAG: TetR/AcrR family transcriptional regulator [Nocardia sp.]|uniref:TetR/AcrR family transcriptional regulator n=1 Tax=Nocardia sp. TaxID=1821 RepID=UPI0026033167|nr:TetR/AcrR family transcriptional regulator [Nocardia sp.]MCU1640476.1 TetR/AcrR family transcriptional regulator [Nocardia sp.]